MIALSRADLRRFRAAARRCLPKGRPRGPAPPARLAGAGGTVTLAAHLGEVILALRAPAAEPSAGAVTVPLSALDWLDAPGPGAVTLEAAGPELVSARWADGAGPQAAEVEAAAYDPAWPDEAERLVPLPPHFPAALHEAGRTAAREPGGRYALHRVQVRGAAGQVVGTDGKQALAWGGFAFPFEDDVLVPAVPVFGSKDVAAEAAVSVGLAGDWVYLVVGPWQVWLLADRRGRFPDVGAAVPRALDQGHAHPGPGGAGSRTSGRPSPGPARSGSGSTTGTPRRS